MARSRILQSLREGHCDVAPLHAISKAHGTIIHPWHAPDAPALKALTHAIAPLLPISRRCAHVKGHGGPKCAVREVQYHLSANALVLRTDVKAFHQSIYQRLLLDKLSVQMVGLYESCDQFVRRGMPETDSVSAFCLRDGVVIAVDTVNRPRDFMVGEKRVAGKLRLSPGDLADEAVDLKNLVG